MKVCLACQARFGGTQAPLGSWTCPVCAFTPQRHDEFLTFAPALALENDGFAESDFARLAPLEATNFWFNARNRLIYWALASSFPKAQSFLEIGCGTGFVLQGIRARFPDLRLAGSEIYTRGLTFAQQRLPDIPLFQMDARHIPFEEEFDVIGAFDVLEHVTEDEEVLRQLYQSVRRGGGIIVSVPQHPRLWNVVDEYSHHKRRYTRAELTSKVGRAGFRVHAVTSFMGLLLPLILASRIRQPKTVEEFDPTSEFRIGSFTNAVLGHCMTFERLLIRAGLSLPAGSSLLLTAMKG